MIAKFIILSTILITTSNAVLRGGGRLGMIHPEEKQREDRRLMGMSKSGEEAPPLTAPPVQTAPPVPVPTNLPSTAPPATAPPVRYQPIRPLQLRPY